MDTVLPKKIGKETRKTKARNPKKRLISHFMQPHYPYLNLGIAKGGISKSKSFVKEQSERENWLNKSLKNLVGRIGDELLGRERMVKYGRWINKTLKGGNETAGNISYIIENYGEEKLKGFYRKNLEFALKECQKLSDRLPGKIVITADHGELLGEDGKYSHPPTLKHPILREVPWFEVSNTKK
ncbi:hypothetical protein AKJ55_01030 [candidate division MSBL1 archaeon SCGC-AAA382M17]|uniref:Uncharacterized protein n=1 Tax=candidate division MSBL1 archaeon SCGC-AAA382M17 TaxID=1698284 RepID=A0ABR5TJP3_9EURY|nr:hypothetical protein AKJ55_01030 [candidate division MSBL1 archaeon SCGC-AAA382M17]